MTTGTKRLSALAVACLLAALGSWTRPAEACPFCSAVTQTLGEELAGSDVGVLAKLVSAPQSAANSADPAAAASLDGTPSRFEIVEVLKGGDLLGDRREVEVVYFGQAELGQTFFIMGSDPAQLVWATPIALSPDAIQYVRQLPKLPPTGPDRLKFFQQYFEHAEPMLAQDSYDEFAKAPYADVKAFRDQMDHDTLLARVGDKNVAASRRRLYLTMLGVCGTEQDLPVLEQMIRAKDPELRTTLDAMVAAYLTLKGPEGMPLIEELFFRDPAADFTDTYSALVALRFHGQEEKIIPRERLLEAFRLMLDRPQYADLVIPDLARWEDWEPMNRLIQLFKEADEQSSWVRTPVIQYLRVCPLPEAAAAISELEAIDPEAVKRANSFLPFATATAPVPAPSAPASETADPAVAQPAASDAAAAVAPAPIESDPAAAPALPPPPVETDRLPSSADSAAGTGSHPADTEATASEPTSLAASEPSNLPNEANEDAESAAENTDSATGAVAAGAGADAGGAPPSGVPPGGTATSVGASRLLAIAGALGLVVLVALLAIVFLGGRGRESRRTA